MKRCGLILLAVSLAVSAPAATRPHYGGTLRLAVRDAPSSLDPANSTQNSSTQTGSSPTRNILRLDL